MDMSFTKLEDDNKAIFFPYEDNISNINFNEINNDIDFLQEFNNLFYICSDIINENAHILDINNNSQSTPSKQTENDNIPTQYTNWKWKQPNCKDNEYTIDDWIDTIFKKDYKEKEINYIKYILKRGNVIKTGFDLEQIHSNSKFFDGKTGKNATLTEKVYKKFEDTRRLKENNYYIKEDYEEDGTYGYKLQHKFQLAFKTSTLIYFNNKDINKDNPISLNDNKFEEIKNILKNEVRKLIKIKITKKTTNLVYPVKMKILHKQLKKQIEDLNKRDVTSEYSNYKKTIR